MLTLVLGGARSGKTGFAERLTEEAAPTRVYVATGQAFDAEMARRIALHKATRGKGWRTVETPLDPASALDQAGPDEAVLLDCLTLWLSNLMHHQHDIEAETARLLDSVVRCAAPVVMVSNEVGLGLVPETPLGRAFRDAQGRLNQQVAVQADRVAFVAAGLPLWLKG